MSKNPPKRPPQARPGQVRTGVKETARSIDRRDGRAPALEAVGSRPAPAMKPKPSGSEPDKP
jgi:hypothetical protein